MIAFIKGKVNCYGNDWLVIDHNSMGWKVYYPHTDKLHLNEDIMVYTYFHYTETEMSLYGFESMQEQELFIRLISVKGLGPKTALNMLMKSTYSRIVDAIENGDVTLLKTMPGIGAKTASQIVLDLKGKLIQATEEKTKDTAKFSQEIQDAVDALKNLGYKAAEANQAGMKMNEKKGLTTDQYLKIGLQFLMKKKLGG